jgi:hypothetical protein
MTISKYFNITVLQYLNLEYIKLFGGKVFLLYVYIQNRSSILHFSVSVEEQLAFVLVCKEMLYEFLVNLH